MIVICLFAAALFSGFLLLHRREGSEIRVSCDGAEVARIVFHASDRDGEPGMTDKRYYLIRSTDGEAVVEPCRDRSALPEGGGYNLISVSKDGVCMEAADCRDQVCVRHRSISAEGESIICLPHRLVVEIPGETHTESLDGMVE